MEEDSYKLYLADKYSIQKNEVFEQFVCKGKMFRTLDDALEHGHELELSAIREEEEVARRRLQPPKEAAKEVVVASEID